MKKELLNKLNIDHTGLSGKQLLLAHSGGLDSSVLAHLLLKAGLNFSVAHCNFQLRASESEADMKFVEAWSREHSIPFFCVKFATEIHKEFYKKSTQVSARDLRYDWFYSLMEVYEFDFLLTAHHLNDQLETFLINTTRATGISGLLGIQEKETLLRPLRTIPKKELIEYAEAEKISWQEDQSNASDVYLRNANRHHVIPAIEEVVPNALQNFQSTLDHLDLANDFIRESLETQKNKLFKNTGKSLSIEIKELEELPSLSFCLHHWFAPFGFDTKEVVKLMESESGKVIYSPSHRLIRDRSSITLSLLYSKEDNQFLFDPLKNNQDLPIQLSCESIEIKGKETWESHQAALDKRMLKKPLSLRKSIKGDYFYPTGMKGKKLLSKFFKDEKYSLLEKEQQWLLCSENKIVWVIGKRCDRRFIATKNSKKALLITVV